MKKVICFILSCVLCLGVTSAAYATPDATWASLPTQSLRASSNGTKYVKAIQRYMMNYDNVTYAYIYDADLSGHGIDGSFGNATRNAVMRFQSQNNLSDSGAVDGNTWKAMRYKLKHHSNDNGFNYFYQDIQAAGESTRITFRQGTTTGNWGSRPWNVTGMTDTTSWNVFNY